MLKSCFVYVRHSRTVDIHHFTVSRTAANPLENVREFKISESEMAYLTIGEIRTLLTECEKSRSKDLTTIVKICLASGARWSEAEGLKGNQIRAGQIIYMKTKGKKNRAVPITEEL